MAKTKKSKPVSAVMEITTRVVVTVNPDEDDSPTGLVNECRRHMQRMFVSYGERGGLARESLDPMAIRVEYQGRTD